LAYKCMLCRGLLPLLRPLGLWRGPWPLQSIHLACTSKRALPSP